MAMVERLSADTAEFAHAVITGGGSGIGRALALALAAGGTEVFVLGRRPEALLQTQALAAGSPGAVHCVPCDVRDEARVEEAFAAIEGRAQGGAQALFHGAADIYTPAPVETVAAADFAEIVTSRLIGTFQVLQRWARPLIAAGRPGVAVVTSSAFASREAPGATHSGASTAGVESLVRSTAREWGRHGIRVNGLAPGVFPSDTVAAAAQAGDTGADTLEATPLGRRLLAATALGRFGTMPEVVGPALFLLSPAARFMSGDVLVLDGGLRLVDWTIIERPSGPAGT